jgi:hypothetical protein
LEQMLGGMAWAVLVGLTLVVLYCFVSTSSVGQSLRHTADADMLFWRMGNDQVVADVANNMAKTSPSLEEVQPVEVAPPVVECDLDCSVKRRLGYFAARAPLSRANIPPFDHRLARA